MANREGSKMAADKALKRLVGQSTHQLLDKMLQARGSVNGAWARLEKMVVHQVARALNALQIPTATDVHELSRRIEALQGAVIALEQRAAESAARVSQAATRKDAGRKKKVRHSKARARA